MASEYNKSVTSRNSVDIANINLSTGNIGAYNKRVSYGTSSQTSGTTSNITMNLDNFLTDNLDEGVTNEKIADPKQYNTDDKKGFFESIGDVFASVGATLAVGTTSVLSGVLDIVEGLGDGVVWVASKAVGIVSPDAEEAMKEFIARDLVTEANEWLYEETEFGRAINDASYMKYDSDTAQGIRSVTTTVTEIAAATALTVATGGAAAPLVVGTAVGLGKAAESTYQTHGTDTTLMQELGIGLSGALNGLSWMANGKLGQGALNILKDSAALGFKSVVSGILKEMQSLDFWKKALKEGLSLKNGQGKVNFNALMNYLTSAFGTAGTLTPYITGEEEFDATAALKLVGTYASYLGFNVLEDIFRDFIGNYSINDEQAQEIAQRILNQELDMRDLQQGGISQTSLDRISREVAKYDVNASRIAPNTTEDILLDIIRRHDGKYGSGSGTSQLLEFCNPNSPNYHNYNLISSHNGGRSLLRQFTPEQIEHAMNNITYNYDRIGDFSGHFTKHGSPADHNYGADQGGIEELCRYEFNNQSYSYRQATAMYNDAIKNGTPIPHFTKIGTPEYFDLKNKLVDQGFSSRDASIIMSTVNDAGACSYATIVNEIFASYLSNPAKFQQDFDYPMYVLNNAGEYVFNSNELLLDLYVFANKTQNGGSFINFDNTINANLLSNKTDVLGRRLLDAEQQEYMSSFHNGKNISAISRFLSEKGVSYNSNWLVQNNPNYYMDNRSFNRLISNIRQELSQGHSVSIDIYYYGTPINMNSTNPNIYGSTSTITWAEGGGHSMFITGLGSDCIYVSSWGKEYAIPFSDLQNGGMFNIFSAIIN